MTEDQWNKKYEPIDNPSEGHMRFATDENDDDAAFVAAVDEHHVWTEVEYEELEEHKDGESSTIFAIVPGRPDRQIKFVCGCMVTKLPWKDSDVDLMILGD
jgi:hypothetical protein